jgi:hypothetical protein
LHIRYLKSLYDGVSVGSLLMEKPDDHSLIIPCHERLVNIFEHTGWGNNSGIDRRVETDLINLTFQTVYSLKIISYEARNLELCMRGWRMYLWIRQYVERLFHVFQVNQLINVIYV